MSVRAALMALRTDLRTPADYRRAAEELRREAMKLERLAAAKERSSAPTSRAGRTPGNAIRIASFERSDAQGLRYSVTIGKQLWYAWRETCTNEALLRAQRIAVRWTPTTAAWLELTGEGDGVAVAIGRGAPRFYVGTQVRDHLPPDGSYGGEIIGERLYIR